MLKNQFMIEAASPGIYSYAHSSSQEYARTRLNLSTIFPVTTATNVAVAVIYGYIVDIKSKPHHLPTRNEEEYSWINTDICCKRKSRMLKSTPTDPLERGAFDFKKNDTVRKNASGKSGKLEESRQIHIIHNSILCYSIHQSQKIIVLKEAANHPALPSIIKSAGLHSSLEDEVVFYHEEQ